VTTEHHGVDVLDGNVKRLGEEHPVAGGVEDAGHADHPLSRKPRGAHGHVAHHVERVRDDHDHRVRRHPCDLLRHRADDSGVRLDEVVSAHARLPRDSRRHHEQLGPGGIVIAIRPEDAAVEPFNRSRLPLVQRLSLRHAFDHVDHQDRARQLLFGEPLRGGGADVPRTHHGNFSEHVRRFRISGSGSPVEL
jgi:hypothetical protein